MGLDVYVGTLTRYFTRDWETIIQQAGREQGIPVELHIANPPADGITDHDAVRQRISTWQSNLLQALAPHIPAGETWSEDASLPYFTDKPGWSGYSSLVLLSIYSQYPGQQRPAEVVQDWSQDRVYQAYEGSEGSGLGGLLRRKLGPPPSGKRYSAITNIEMWLPLHFDGRLQAGGLTSQEMGIASVLTLKSELAEINEQTYAASPETMRAWLFEDLDDTFDQEARRGLAIFTELVGHAAECALPVKLDY